MMYRIRIFRAIALVALVAVCMMAVDRQFFYRSGIVATVHAAAPQYKVVRISWVVGAQALESQVNEIAAQGWELQNVTTFSLGADSFSNLVFRKRA
jgi:hypothetical protein